MMYLHFCKNCKHIYILNGHKQKCPKCKSSLTELQMTYLEYTALNPLERRLFLELCQNETLLQEISITYRMHKYSKWYKNTLNVSTITSF